LPRGRLGKGFGRGHGKGSKNHPGIDEARIYRGTNRGDAGFGGF
jgi:hypothetical protein